MFLTILAIAFLILPCILFMSAIGRKRRPSEKYLYHVTTLENANKIVQNGLATIRPATGLNAYSNFFRPTTFYFSGIPNYMQVAFNLPNAVKRKDLVAVRVDIQDIPSNIHMKSRFLDKAFFHTGALNGVPAEIVKIPKERIQLVLEPFLLLIVLFFITSITLISTTFIG